MEPRAKPSSLRLSGPVPLSLHSFSQLSWASEKRLRTANSVQGSCYKRAAGSPRDPAAASAGPEREARPLWGPVGWWLEEASGSQSGAGSAACWQMGGTAVKSIPGMEWFYLGDREGAGPALTVLFTTGMRTSRANVMRAVGVAGVVKW